MIQIHFVELQLVNVQIYLTVIIIVDIGLDNLIHSHIVQIVGDVMDHILMHLHNQLESEDVLGLTMIMNS